MLLGRREAKRAAARNLDHVPEDIREAARQGIARDERAYEEAAKRDPNV